MPIKHGLTKTRIYRIWRRMIDRTTNIKHPAYQSYKLRNILPCINWISFMGFKNDMYESYLSHCLQFGEKNTTLERIDNKLGYNLKNCRWATCYEQQQNRKDSKFLTFQGITLTQAEWAKKLGLIRNTLRSRVYRKLPIEKVLSTNLYKL